MLILNKIGEKSSTFKFGHYRPEKLDIKFTVFCHISKLQPSTVIFLSFFITVFYCKLHCNSLQYIITTLYNGT